MRRAISTAFSRPALRAWGIALAIFSVIAPALPLGPLFSQPPFPLAVLWAAYGWAAEDEASLRAPIMLAVLGLVHDQLAGGPFGLFPAIYLSAYIIGRVIAVAMSAPNLVSLWGGFIATALATILVAGPLARWALGREVSVRSYAEAAMITALLFPIFRPLYMDTTQNPRTSSRGRR
jgi:rod shape-determining protein MreD